MRRVVRPLFSDLGVCGRFLGISWAVNVVCVVISTGELGVVGRERRFLGVGDAGGEINCSCLWLGEFGEL